MHAVAVKVAINDRENAQKVLEERVVPASPAGAGICRRVLDSFCGRKQRAFDARVRVRGRSSGDGGPNWRHGSRGRHVRERRGARGSRKRIARRSRVAPAPESRPQRPSTSRGGGMPSVSSAARAGAADDSGPGGGPVVHDVGDDEGRREEGQAEDEVPRTQALKIVSTPFRRTAVPELGFVSLSQPSTR